MSMDYRNELQSSQNYGGTNSQAHLDVGGVQMMPQDEGEIRSENDLGFMTEVDPIYVPKGKES